MALALLLGGCSADPGQPDDASPSATTGSSPLLPLATDEAILAKDAALAATLDEELAAEEFADLRSIVVLAEGRTVYERYFASDPADRHLVWSVTKSVVSTLVGIAIGEGLIDGLDSTLGELLPDHVEEMSPRVAGVSLEELLTMTGGFTDPANLTSADDLVPRLLRQYQVRPPGEFLYCDTSAHLVSAIVAEATGMSVLDYARSRLFEPLGIETTPAEEPSLAALDLDGPAFGWAVDGDGIHGGGTGLRLRAQDMAKLGLLYAQNGSWEGRSVVPETWIRSATSKHETDEYGWGYGYFWWLPSALEGEGFEASGSGGQRILVVPDSNLVAVTQGWLDPVTKQSPTAAEVDRLLEEVIVPALR